MTTSLPTPPFPFLERLERHDDEPISVRFREEPRPAISPVAISVPPPRPSGAKLLAQLPLRFGR